MLSRGHNIGTVAFHKLLRATVVYTLTYQLNNFSTSDMSSHIKIALISQYLENIPKPGHSQTLAFQAKNRKIEKPSDFFKDCKQWHGYVTEQNRTITQGPFEVIPDLLIFLLIKTDLICSKN